MILIVYTTEYRTGSDKFARIAATMLGETQARYSGEVKCVGIHGKKDLNAQFENVASQNKKLDEFHFIGHSGMYGPMYGTMNYPEQYSPYELKNLHIPFAENAKACFHCCRSARWFAPFFAEHFGVEAFGYHWYTTFSSDPKKYKPVRAGSRDVYAAGCIGKKSHGWIGSVKKYSGASLEVMKSFKPTHAQSDSTYNPVAELYDAVFQDIKVRKDEWKWITDHLPASNEITVADIGCGNGALLKELSPRIKNGIGLDISSGILERARRFTSGISNLDFRQLNGPKLPLEDHSVDVFISMLSFRYLDWDPLMDEVKRVLKPGGKVMIIDMVTVPAKWHEFPLLIRSKMLQYSQRFTQPVFRKNLNRLVTHPAWKEMLKHNPIRAEHEMKWYLESRFPSRKVEKINVGWNSCILAFDSGTISGIKDIYLTYP
jgi:ubiquinone/menaquinone biosynthesis C-methylase UbiE